MALLVMLSISALSIAAYDKLVRQPRTPRLAVVDVGEIYRLRHQKASAAVVRSQGDTSATEAATVQSGHSGAEIQAALTELATECGCTLVAMAAVFGDSRNVPDYTAEIKRRMGL